MDRPPGGVRTAPCRGTRPCTPIDPAPTATANGTANTNPSSLTLSSSLTHEDHKRSWKDRVVLVGSSQGKGHGRVRGRGRGQGQGRDNFGASGTKQRAPLARRRQQRQAQRQPEANSPILLRFAPLTSDVGWISMSDAALQRVDIARHPVRSGPGPGPGRGVLRRKLPRRTVRGHAGCCTAPDLDVRADSGSNYSSAYTGRRRHHHRHYHCIPGQVVFSWRNAAQGRETY